MKTERFDIPLPDGAVIDHDLTKLDENYVNSGNSIGISYLFERALSAETLRVSLTQLLAEYPALAGRADFTAMRVSGDDPSVYFEHVTEFGGSAQDYAAPDHVIHNRLDFVHEPRRKDIECGTAPLMCVRLTEFKDGGCALGVTINHGLMDAWGFHKIMRRWSEIITGHNGDECPVMNAYPYAFKTDRTPKEILADIKAVGMTKPLNFKTPMGRFIKWAMYGMLDKIRARDREMIYLSPEQITVLKKTVHAESGLEWISTNVALSAHIIHAILPLQRSSKTTTLGIGNVINIRGRTDPQTRAAQNAFAGNALLIHITEKTYDKPVVELMRGEIARELRAAFDALTEDRITRDMSNIVDSLEAGYGYPGLNLLAPIMAVNNQSKFDVYGVDFGAGRPLRVIPQDVGDHIMIFPSYDGGAEVYIRDFTSLKRQKELREPEWQARLFDI